MAALQVQLVDDPRNDGPDGAGHGAADGSGDERGTLITGQADAASRWPVLVQRQQPAELSAHEGELLQPDDVSPGTDMEEARYETG